MEDTDMSKQSPERTFRIGNVSASVFLQKGGEREFRTVALQRSYLDGDERKYSSSFALQDLPTAVRVLQMAQAHVEEAEVS